MNEKPARLEPPFSVWSATAVPLRWSPKIVHPAAVAHHDELIRPTDDMKAYLEFDLIPTRVDRVYPHLFYAGAPRFARALHRQKLMGREVVITEDVSEHLVWYQSRIFIKPLSAYLLDADFWERHLCSDADLHRSACGFLLSYIWLVSRESDFRLGRDEMHLLPKELDWETWSAIVTSFTGHIDTKYLHQVARRYHYGELRLSRLNRIYRYTPALFSLRNLFKAFLSPSTWYQELFRQNFGWLLAVFAFFSVSLSGLQVALATDQLAQDASFQRISYGFAMFSLVAIAASLVVIFVTWLVLTAYFYTSATIYHRRIQSERARKQTEAEQGLQG